MKAKPFESPLASIIVTNYNYGCFLREAIDSALNQTYPYTEVIVVDDGSTDDSQETIASYSEEIIPVLKENGGQASAFNAGFSISQGEVVIFLDADDYLSPSAIERVIAVWEETAVTVQYRLNTVDAFGNPLGFYPPREIPLYSGEVWRVLLDKGYYLHPPTSGNSFSREVLDQVLPMPEPEWRIVADAYLATLVPFFGRVCAIEEALGAYRIHEHNQWILNGVPSIKKLRATVQYDLQVQALVVRKANELGYKVPPDLSLRNYGNLVSRLILQRLDPQENPVFSDGPASVVYWGLRAVWRYSEFPWKKRLMYSVWFVWFGLLPLPVAKPAVAWLFTPQSRPRALEWIRKKFRSL